MVEYFCIGISCSKTNMDEFQKQYAS
jgi:hypothetical protein